MLPTEVIHKPLVTEKATAATDANRYSFSVDRRATKTDIKKAVEALYKVRVVGVATINRKARNRSYRYGMIEGKTTKRAIVRVHADDKIELF
ncbi:MAG: 50S ribosomal protein L23 [Phycisphaerae bacterium]|jgi:large subunit ribosomal protein L23|nr:50S ribosomal protein L23 [Phycisphaerae bacterium]